jgi:hypothetical protein
MDQESTQIITVQIFSILLGKERYNLLSSGERKDAYRNSNELGDSSL